MKTDKISIFTGFLLLVFTHYCASTPQDFIVTPDASGNQFKTDPIICPRGSNCIVNCSSHNSCYQSIVDASNANSLVLYCSNQGSCQAANLICPIQGFCQIACTALNSCYQAVITGGQHNPAPINLLCSAPGACQEVQLGVGETKSFATIICSEKNSCYRSNFYVAGSSIVRLQCDNTGACQEMQFTGPHSGAVDIFCNDFHGSCYSALITTTLTSGVYLHCVGENSCHAVHTACPSRGVCVVKCSGALSCYTSSIKSSFLCMQCSGERSCSDARIEATEYSHVQCTGKSSCEGVEWNLPNEFVQTNFQCPNLLMTNNTLATGLFSSDELDQSQQLLSNFQL